MSLESIPIEKIRISEFNVRAGEEFGDEEDLEFADNIEAYGIQEPIVVRPFGDMYEVTIGRRRFLSARHKGQSEILAIVRDYTDEEALDSSLIETIFKRETNPVAIGRAIAKRLEMSGLSLSEYSRMTGKSKSTLSEWLRMNDLSPAMQSEVQSGNIPFIYALKVARMDLSPAQESVLLEESRTGGLESFKNALDRIAKSKEKRGAPKGLQIVRINFGLESQDFEALSRISEAKGMNLSDYCLKVLTDHIRASNT